MFKWCVIAALCFSGSLTAETKILALAGSTREDSCNMKLAKEAATMAKKMGAIVTVINLKDYPMPFYDGDLEAAHGLPENAKKLRSLIMANHAVIIASPEYNGSVSAVLKNALDWASRTDSDKSGRDVFGNRVFALLSCSPGSSGGARGLVHLRTILENVGGKVVAKQVSVPNAFQAFDSEGHLIDADLKKELAQEVQQLIP